MVHLPLPRTESTVVRHACNRPFQITIEKVWIRPIVCFVCDAICQIIDFSHWGGNTTDVINLQTCTRFRIWLRTERKGKSVDWRRQGRYHSVIHWSLPIMRIVYKGRNLPYYLAGTLGHNFVLCWWWFGIGNLWLRE